MEWLETFQRLMGQSGDSAESSARSSEAEPSAADREASSGGAGDSAQDVGAPRWSGDLAAEGSSGEFYVDEEVRRYVDSQLAPVLQFVPLLQGLAQVLYAEYSKSEVARRLQEDVELQGMLDESAVGEIQRLALERFGGDVGQAYEVYTASLRRARARLAAERPVREDVVRNGAPMSPGDILRSLVER